MGYQAVQIPSNTIGGHIVCTMQSTIQWLMAFSGQGMSRASIAFQYCHIIWTYMNLTSLFLLVHCILNGVKSHSNKNDSHHPNGSKNISGISGNCFLSSIISLWVFPTKNKKTATILALLVGPLCSNDASRGAWFLGQGPFHNGALPRVWCWGIVCGRPSEIHSMEDERAQEEMQLQTSPNYVSLH